MRYLALIAVFSLQLSMFVCGAGIDVCHAADTTAQIQLSSSQSDTGQQSSPIEICAAHAAHTFLAQASLKDSQVDSQITKVEHVVSLHLLDVSHLIEQPPKPLHS